MIDTGYLSESIKNINSKYPNINYGGCGTFSYHLHRVLKEKHNTPTEIVYIPSPSPPGLKPDYDIWFSHIMVKMDNVVIDNNGLHQYNEKSFKNLSVEKLEEMVNIPELWNNKFDQLVYNRDLNVERVSDKLIKDIYLI